MGERARSVLEDGIKGRRNGISMQRRIGEQSSAARDGM